MSRRLAVLFAGTCGLYQALILVAFPPLFQGLFPPGMVERIVNANGLRLLGMGVDGFAVWSFSDPVGWVPQLAFIVGCVLLAYAVFRASPDLRPRVRTVAALIGATLLAAGIAELLVRALDTADRPDGVSYRHWFLGVQLQDWSPGPALYAAWASWMTVLLWAEAWFFRRWRPMRQFLGRPGDADTGRAERTALLSTKRERRDAVAAGLLPVVLLSVAGGQVLRHTNVRHVEQSSIAFDPELVLPYRPPPLVDSWSGVLYPALRMRPLATENAGGWLATLAIFLVLLAVLSIGLRAVARSASREHPVHAFLDCWCMTLVAAVVAGLVEAVLLHEAAPRLAAYEFVGGIGAPVGNAVRFGAVWGWATGGAFLGAVMLLSRRSRRRETPSEGRAPSHVG